MTRLQEVASISCAAIFCIRRSQHSDDSHDLRRTYPKGGHVRKPGILFDHDSSNTSRNLKHDHCKHAVSIDYGRAPCSAKSIEMAGNKCKLLDQGNELFSAKALEKAASCLATQSCLSYPRIAKIRVRQICQAGRYIRTKHFKYNLQFRRNPLGSKSTKHFKFNLFCYTAS